MNNETLKFSVSLKVQEENGEIINLKKVEEFEVKNNKFSEKVVTFQADNGKEYRFAITISGLGWFSIQPGSSIRQSGQNLKVMERRILLISWRKKESALVIGAMVFVLVGFVIFGLVFWNKKKQQV